MVKMALPIKCQHDLVRMLMKSIRQRFSVSCCFAHSEIRTRFAPSPTGFMHYGSLRTALYNYAFAKSHNGTFILRIEDTDLTRAKEGAEENFRETLHHFGLIPDEGPWSGGKYGPYRQSERSHFYEEYIQKLLQEKKAFRCFCTPQALRLKKKHAVSSNEVNDYDGTCTHLDEDQVQRKLEKNIPHTIRFKFKDFEREILHDEVYGEISAKYSSSFPILIKSDGFPVYHFANVVDDHLMKISHVFRGEEWLVSTGLHVALYSAFGWEAPKFIHTPLILMDNGRKLSKREGAANLSADMKSGIPAYVFLNFLTKTGGGFLQNEDLVELPDLVKLFNIKCLSRHSARLRESEKIRKCRQFYSSIIEKYGLEEIVKKLLHVIHNKDVPYTVNQEFSNEEYVKKVVQWAVPSRCNTLDDIFGQTMKFIWQRPTEERIKTLINNLNIPPFCILLLTEFNQSAEKNFKNTKEWVKQRCAEEGKELNANYKPFIFLIRMCLSPTTHGPSVIELSEIFDSEEINIRLEFGLDVIKDVYEEQRNKKAVADVS